MAANGNEVILISDDDAEQERKAHVSLCDDEGTKPPKQKAIEVPSSPLSPSISNKKQRDLASYFTPERARKRRANGGTNTREGSALKPLTPSSAVKSSMNASLVFDMVTSLSTNDPGVAIATLRSIVVLGKEYPSTLLFDELIDRIQSVEAVAYADAVSIYASLVFVFDKAASCSCELMFPHQWEPLANTLQDISTRAMDEMWRRNLLVVRFYIYCFYQDLSNCRNDDADDEWITQTRIFRLLGENDAPTAKKPKKRSTKATKVRNNLILQAIGCAMQLWKQVYDQPNPLFPQEGEDACLAVIRLMEMLYLCTDQMQNILQRIHAGLLELKPATRTRFAHAIQSPELKVRIATQAIGLTNKSRTKEYEWLESNAMGRVLQGLNNDGTSELATADHYSWAHYETLLTAPAPNDFARLLQEIARVQQDQ